MIAVIWVGLSLLVASWGKNKGVGTFGMTLVVSLLFSPIIGALVVAVSKPSDKLLSRSGLKKCPFCAEFVKNEAKVCKHCGKTFES